MKRLHVSFNVSDLEKSVIFYQNLFAQPPSVLKDDYAKWLLDDPHVNFVLEARGEPAGFGHAGLQVDQQDELQPVFDRMKEAEAPYLPEGVTTCCYAKSEKSWTADPDGVLWEAFYTLHQSEQRETSDIVAEPQIQASCCCSASSDG